MILDSINISSYELNFKKQYINAKFKLSNRKGWIIQLTSNGFTGYGDCSPMGYFKIIAPVEGFIGVFLMSYFSVAFVRKILR